MPAHAEPLQPVNVAPEFGTAVSVIPVPAENELPVGDCVTVPGPFAVTEKLYSGSVKFAVTVVSAVSTKLHVVAVLPAHWVPVQFVNCALAAGEAARVTVVLFGNDVPEGDWVMVPSPTTEVVRVNFVSEVTPEPTSCAIGPVLDSLSVAESEAAR